MERFDDIEKNNAYRAIESAKKAVEDRKTRGEKEPANPEEPLIENNETEQILESKLDEIFEAISADNLKIKINEIRSLLRKYPKMADYYRQKIRWERNDADSKQNTGTPEEKGKSFSRLKMLVEINRSIDLDKLQK